MLRQRINIFIIGLIFVTLSAPLVVAQYGRGSGRTGMVRSRPLPCESSSCYPATGNLLIGREHMLRASSTCGLEGPERYCIVTHLKDRKKCFFCDASQPRTQHNISNVVSKYSSRNYADSWWQSENGKENVSIQLDLESEFHFTHIVITFKTFRPAAMLIERSYDYGKTWQVYRYFAQNCRESFPGIPTVTSQVLSHVNCESRYSQVVPSTDGEVIMRVLPSYPQIDNPYAKEVQNLLKVTNLRINFTKLITLGDNLLDNRAEIREKYYYAIKDMVIRGSCSCYGHASRCLPLPGIPNYPEMVHGQCECTHNTTGLNCEKCKDFYNDLPWRPAAGGQINACRICKCNNHASSCHFDQTVYERSGRDSGGVCDDCQHNTMGQNCELCKPFYYHEPSRDISDPNVCQPCNCDLAGSVDDGICDSRTDELSGDESGRCHCKANIEGRRCDRCKNGFWNFDANNPEGCQACTCDTRGTIGNRGCDVVSGMCSCKRFVTGRDCNQCLPEFWGLSMDRDGCRPCDCDPGGAYDNFCDVVNGQCRCRPNIGGRTCNEPQQSFYTGFIEAFVYEAELSKPGAKCQIIIREPYRDGRNNTWTGTGFVRAFEGSTVTFDIDDIRRSGEYDIVLRYEPEIVGDWHNIEIILDREYPPNPRGSCRNWNPTNDRRSGVQLHSSTGSAVVLRQVCLEVGQRYTVVIDVKVFDPRRETPSASILIDSISLVPRIESIPFFTDSPLSEIRRQEYERYHCGDVFYDPYGREREVSEECRKYHYSIGTYILDGAQPCECNPTGSYSLLCDKFGGACSCKPNVVGRRCDRCAPGTYNFGPEGCKACDCDSVGALDNFCDVETGRCACRPNTYSRTCGFCQPGFWNFPHCTRCECNGHADTCDSKSGDCLECRDFTTGHNCDRCVETFYGDPRLGVDIPCRACPCPGTIDSGHSYADTCSLDPITADVICECRPGYSGARCEYCAENYFGNPDETTGSCSPCDCSNNVDPSRPGNCDARTGKCLACLYNTFGFNCQICRPGFYGDALSQDCKECGCNLLGSDRNVSICDHRTGQCPCLPHVVGQHCDRCEEYHWRIASGSGCDPCDCDAVGSVSDRCNEYDGMCQCRRGFGGRQCNQCETNFWGNPNVECRPCECDLDGSATQQCDRDTGHCICRPGIGGEKCDHCDRGYVGSDLRCSACGECFDNWDETLRGLSNYTQKVIADAATIQKVGTTGLYSQEFDEMDKTLDQIAQLVSNTSVRAQDLDLLIDAATTLANHLKDSSVNVETLDGRQVEMARRVNLVDTTMKDMKNKNNALHQKAAKLRENGTRLQEANVQGALKVTQLMAEQSELAQKMATDSSTIVADAERYHKNAELLVSKNDASFTEARDQNVAVLKDLDQHLSRLNAKLPDLNEEMCGDHVANCSDLCGGAGCGICGGISCDNGALTKVDQALDLAKREAARIANRKDIAEQLLRNMTEATQDARAARSNAQDAYNSAVDAEGKTEDLVNKLLRSNDAIQGFLEGDGTTPSEVRAKAEEALGKTIGQNQGEIKALADNISDLVASLKNPEAILAATADDLARARDLLQHANYTRNQADEKQQQAGRVISLLNDTLVAQKFAAAAIDKAHNDTVQSEAQLAAIVSQMKSAQTEANNTTAAVDALDERLQELQTTLAKTDYGINDTITAEAQNVLEQARASEIKTRKLAQDYDLAKRSLANRSAKSKDDRDKAERLLRRATKLTADTVTKFKDLDGMEVVYTDNEKKLAALMGIVISLTSEMEDHLAGINEKSLFYRRCVT